MGGPVQWSSLPVPALDGTLVPHLSARYRTMMFDAVFENIGGFLGFSAWAEQSNENRTEFYKMWARGQAKASSVEIGLGGGVEDLLARLDAGDAAKVVSTGPDDAEIVGGE